MGIARARAIEASSEQRADCGRHAARVAEQRAQRGQAESKAYLAGVSCNPHGTARRGAIGARRFANELQLSEARRRAALQ